MQTINPYNTAKTAEIMARYRPIAPKPENPANPNEDNDSSMPQGIRKSPYLMNVWNHLQARPTRTRKRGRTALAPPSLKRKRACLQGLSLPYYNQVMANSPAAKNLALQGFVHDPTSLPSLSFLPNLLPLKCGLDTPVTTPSNTVSLPLMPCPSGGTALELLGGDNEGPLDLNKVVDVLPQEVDFMHQLGSPKKVAVILPQAIRPVGSSISVGIITEDPSLKNPGKKLIKKPEEVEKEMEFEALPAVVSDSNNKVRLTNAAYNEMVGQPECPWLDFTSSGGPGIACKRIGGEVVLDFLNSCNLPKLLSSDGFTCWVRIEWGKDDKKSVVNAFCDVIRLACESKDYLFEWRFHTREASESGSNV